MEVGINFTQYSLLAVRVYATNGIHAIASGQTKTKQDYFYNVTVMMNQPDQIGDELLLMLATAIAVYVTISFLVMERNYLAPFSFLFVILSIGGFGL